MTDKPTKQTPEQLAAIRERHKNADETQYMMRPPGGLLGAGDYAHKDRAALLGHVEALEGEVERLRDENRHLSHLVNISPETAKLSSPAIAIVAQHDADNRVKAVERKLARLVERLCEECIYWANAPTKKGMDYAAALQAIIVEATGDGK